MLIHGVTASARIWWRVGPALAATGRRVVAPDLPGHGLTGHWTGHHRFRDNAADVAAWIRAAGLDVPDLQVVGHSWGAMTAAALPLRRDPAGDARPARSAGRPARRHLDRWRAIRPSVPYPDLDERGRRPGRAANPAWPTGTSGPRPRR